MLMASASPAAVRLTTQNPQARTTRGIGKWLRTGPGQRKKEREEKSPSTHPRGFRKQFGLVIHPPRRPCPLCVSRFFSGAPAHPRCQVPEVVVAIICRTVYVVNLWRPARRQHHPTPNHLLPINVVSCRAPGVISPRNGCRLIYCQSGFSSMAPGGVQHDNEKVSQNWELNVTRRLRFSTLTSMRCARLHH